MIQEPKCSKRNCIHFIGVKNDGDETTERVVCAAYPDGIPDVIAYGKNKHKKIRKDQDNEIVFEKET
jgi:hypothetical protein